MDEPSTQAPLDWRNIILLGTVHLVALGGLPLYLWLHGLTTAAAVIGLVLTPITVFSISAGYHRLFSHRTYQAHPLFRLFLLTVGAGAFQNSVLAWAADHRRHHARTDSPLDPYSVRGGFWHAHIGWVLRKTPAEIAATPVPDLERDPLVRWQARYYAFIGIASGLVLPTALGWAFGDPLGGFVIGAALRLLIVYHVTFAVNSFAHTFGTRPYSERSSARDSFLTALVSMGEGYHNFHHTFPADYRNGVRAHHFDPTKWTLRLLSWVGLVSNLRRTSPAAMIRARLRVDELRLEQVPSGMDERLRVLREDLDRILGRFSAVAASYEQARSHATAQAQASLRTLREQIRSIRQELEQAYAGWQRALHSALGAPEWARAPSRSHRPNR